MFIPLKADTKGRHSSSLTFLLTGQLTVGGRPNLLIHGRYLRYIDFVKESVKHIRPITPRYEVKQGQ